MDIPVLYTPTDLTLVFTFTLLLLIVYHQAVELIDILIGLLTSILLRIVRLGIPFTAVLELEDDVFGSCPFLACSSIFMAAQ